MCPSLSLSHQYIPINNNNNTFHIHTVHHSAKLPTNKAYALLPPTTPHGQDLSHADENVDGIHHNVV